MTRPRSVTALVSVLAVLAGSAAAAAVPADVEVLRDLSLEQLVQLQVTSASKRPEMLDGVPASMAVVTQDAIRRTGVASLPEALRLAPNLHVGRIDTLGYAISARGFNSYQTANKLLVLIDGRSVYSPLQSGVFWDAQRVALEDVQRIEVISGPGGTLWGSNAVNGVVNVISKNAADTQGTLISGALGTEEKRATLRHGAQLGAAHVRAYALGFEQRRPRVVDSVDVRDDWSGVQGGFRLDWAGAADTVTLQGDIYRFEAELLPPGRRVRFHLDGFNTLLQWRRPLEGGSGLEVDAYFDKADRNALSGLQKVETTDVELRHVVAGARHKLVIGGGYRLIHDDYFNPLNPFQLDPRERWLQLGNLFVQDEISLRPDLRLTLGLKLEQSSFTGLEILPGARIAWQASETGLVWAALSRAARAPNRIERELVFPGVLVKGDFRSERLTAVEAGYRGRPFPDTSLSVSAFHNWYDGLRTTEGLQPGTLPVRYANGLDARTFGVEAWADHQLTPWWQIGVSVTALRKLLDLAPGRIDFANRESAGNDPDVQFQLRSQMDVTDAVWLDVRLRHVGELPRPRVPAYTGLDVTAGWQVAAGLELVLNGYNLLNGSHSETGEPPARRAFRRGVTVAARWEL